MLQRRLPYWANGGVGVDAKNTLGVNFRFIVRVPAVAVCVVHRHPSHMYSKPQHPSRPCAGAGANKLRFTVRVWRLWCTDIRHDRVQVHERNAPTGL